MRGKLFLFLAIILFGSGALRAQLRFFAGPQITTARYTIRGVKQQTDTKNGFTAGLGLTTLIEGPVYFTPLFYYSKKGYKVTFDRPAFPPDSAAKNNNTSLNTVEIAPLIQINFSKKSDYLFLRIGPSVDINISGREVYDSLANKRVERAMPFGFGEYGYLTASFNIQLGYQLKKGLSLFAYYQHGIGSLNNADNGPTILHRIAGISVGWQLRKRK